jgi:hypothetical protein
VARPAAKTARKTGARKKTSGELTAAKRAKATTVKRARKRAPAQRAQEPEAN